MHRRFDPWLVIAMSWLFASIAATIIFWPMLGLRGMCWMVLHHALCVVGTSHQLRRSWIRRRALQEQGLAPPFLWQRPTRRKYWAESGAP